MLSDRRQRVLAALIEEYVARALPVGSQTLTERYHLGVSPATVRNELSILEDGGYIIQPHTSAGRIPTDFGYRAFVDRLFESGFCGVEPRDDSVAEKLRSTATELDALLEQTSAALARLTECLSIVIAPTIASVHLKHLTLVSLDQYHAIAVLVTEDGRVFNRPIEFESSINSYDLAQVQNYLNEKLAGLSLSELETGMVESLKEAFNNPLLALVFEEILICAQENRSSGIKAHRLGMSALLTQPEFAYTQAILPVVHILEDDTVLLHILDNAASAGENDGVSVRIGAENGSEDLSGVSVVASRYGRGSAAGVVAVIGPTRMDYSKVLQAVRTASSVLDDS